MTFEDPTDLFDQLSAQTPYPHHLAQQAIAWLSQLTPLWHLGHQEIPEKKTVKNIEKTQNSKLGSEKSEKSNPATNVPRYPEVSWGVWWSFSASGRKETLRRLRLPPASPPGDTGKFCRFVKNTWEIHGTPKTEWLITVYHHFRHVNRLPSSCNPQPRPSCQEKKCGNLPTWRRPYCPDNLPYIGESKINKGTSSKSLKNGELLWDLDEIELGARWGQTWSATASAEVYILHYTSEMPRLSIGGMTERLRQVKVLAWAFTSLRNSPTRSRRVDLDRRLVGSLLLQRKAQECSTKSPTVWASETDMQSDSALQVQNAIANIPPRAQILIIPFSSWRFCRDRNANSGLAMARYSWSTRLDCEARTLQQLSTFESWKLIIVPTCKMFRDRK